MGIELAPSPKKQKWCHPEVRRFADAWIDEPVKNAQETNESRDNGRSISADNRAVCHNNVNGDVKSNVAQHRIEQPAKYHGEHGTRHRNAVTPENELTRNGIK